MAKVTGLHNPDPSDIGQTPYYTVDKSGESLWDIAMSIVQEEAAAKGQPFSSTSALNTATENELGVIKGANPQLLDKPQGYDLIYIGDKIAVPPQTFGTSFGAVNKPEPKGTTGFTPPTQQKTGAPGGGTTSVLQPGQDILSTNGQYDLVLGNDGQLILYKLHTPYERPENYAPGLPDSPTVVWQSNPDQKVASAIPTAYGVQMLAADGTQVGTLTEGTLTDKMPLPGNKHDTLSITDNSVG